MSSTDATINFNLAYLRDFGDKELSAPISRNTEVTHGPDCAKVHIAAALGSGLVFAYEPRPFAGYKFLIIEDEIMQAWHVGDMLTLLGGAISKIAFSYDQGRDALARTDWDCAIVDINLNGKPVFPLVAIMEQEGIPFVYCSAYADLLVEVYPEYTSAVCVSKPVTIEKLRDAVLLVLQPREG